MTQAWRSQLSDLGLGILGFCINRVRMQGREDGRKKHRALSSNHCFPVIYFLLGGRVCKLLNVIGAAKLSCQKLFSLVREKSCGLEISKILLMQESPISS